MGVFDSLWWRCPNCGERNEFQSKAHKCLLRDYSAELPERIPLAVLADFVDSNPHHCESCRLAYVAQVYTQPILRITPATISDEDD